MELSLVMSVASACFVSSFLWKKGLSQTYQVEDASRGGLVLSALGEEEQALARLASPGGDRVGHSGLLVLVVDGELLVLDGLIVEVEETLREAQAPFTVSTFSFTPVAAQRT